VSSIWVALVVAAVLWLPLLVYWSVVQSTDWLYGLALMVDQLKGRASGRMPHAQPLDFAPAPAPTDAWTSRPTERGTDR
jgi:hypothetical protein